MIYKCNKMHSVCRLGFYSDRLLIADRAGPQASGCVGRSVSLSFHDRRVAFSGGQDHTVAVWSHHSGRLPHAPQLCGDYQQGEIVRRQCPVLAVGSSDTARLHAGNGSRPWTSREQSLLRS
jgi:hypothetical protein